LSLRASQTTELDVALRFDYIETIMTAVIFQQQHDLGALLLTRAIGGFCG